MKKLLLSLALLTGTVSLFAQGNVGIGTAAPNASAVLDVSSTTKGLLPPRMTTAQRDAITTIPAGLVIYNTTTNCLEFWNGGAWISTCATTTLAPCPAPSAVAVSGPATLSTGGSGTYSMTGGTPNTGITWSISPTAGVSTTSGTGTTTGAITFSTAGTYTVTFTATNNSNPGGCAPSTAVGTRTVTVSSTPPAPTLVACTPKLGPNDFPGAFIIGGNTVNVTAAHSGTTFSSIINNCNVSSTTNAFLTSSNTTTTFTFDRPVSNIQFLLSGTNNNEVHIITAQDASGAVSPTITLFGSNCPGSWSVSGNQISAPGGGGPGDSGTGAGTYFNLGGVYYTSITITRPVLSPSAGSALNVMFCNGSSL